MSTILPFRSVAPSRRSPHIATLGATVGAILLLGVAPPPASADVGTKIIERCTHGESLSGYSQQDYRKALQEIPTEVEEYSDCGELIHKAQLAAASGSASGPTGAASSATAPIAVTPAEQQAIEKVHHTGSAPVQVGSQIIRPGVVHANIASAISALPTPLIVVLSLMLVCGCAVGGRELRNRVLSARDHD
jgi:hypothetical protein